MDRKKFAKQKDREREARKKVLLRRGVLQKQTSENNKLELEAKKASKKLPINNKAFYAAKAARDAEIKNKLVHNQKILNALEEEMAKQDKEKAAVAENN